MSLYKYNKWPGHAFSVFYKFYKTKIHERTSPFCMLTKVFFFFFSRSPFFCYILTPFYFPFIISEFSYNIDLIIAFFFFFFLGGL
jgi:hypothetical protein